MFYRDNSLLVFISFIRSTGSVRLSEQILPRQAQHWAQTRKLTVKESFELHYIKVTKQLCCGAENNMSWSPRNACSLWLHSTAVSTTEAKLLDTKCGITHTNKSDSVDPNKHLVSTVWY